MQQQSFSSYHELDEDLTLLDSNLLFHPPLSHFSGNPKCNYPSCATMVYGDELCDAVTQYDAREYYTSEKPDGGYLPLGQRVDTWRSLQTKRWTKRRFRPPSERRYAFNAIFSQSTSDERQDLAGEVMAHFVQRRRLAKIIDEQHDGTMTIFTHMAKVWKKNVNSPNTEQLGNEEYVDVVLDSAFTLAPTGHNPEW